MPVIACNKCFRLRGYDQTTPQQFHLLLCRHILCHECMESKCAVCQRPGKSISIEKDMPVGAAAYFEDPIKQFQRYQKTVKFQLEQESYLAGYYANTLPKQRKQRKREYNSIVTLDTKLLDCMEVEKRRIDKCKAYVEYHDRRAAQVTQSQRRPSQRVRPATPTMSSVNSEDISLQTSSSQSKKSSGFDL